MTTSRPFEETETGQWMIREYKRLRARGLSHDESMASIRAEIESIDYAALAKELMDEARKKPS